jgi:hypothetical protein
MNWLKRVLRNWLHSDTRFVADSHAPHSPLMYSLGEAGDRHYVAVPVENGFALITRDVGDPHSGINRISPRAAVTFCRSAEELSNTLVAKMAQHKLTAR